MKKLLYTCVLFLAFCSILGCGSNSTTATAHAGAEKAWVSITNLYSPLEWQGGTVKVETSQALQYQGGMADVIMITIQGTDSLQGRSVISFYPVFTHYMGIKDGGLGIFTEANNSNSYKVWGQRRENKIKASPFIKKADGSYYAIFLKDWICSGDNQDKGTFAVSLESLNENQLTEISLDVGSLYFNVAGGVSKYMPAAGGSGIRISCQ